MRQSKVHGYSNGIKWMIGVWLGVMLVLMAACGNDTKVDQGGPDDVQVGLEAEPANLIFFSSAAWSQEAFNERFGDAIRRKFPHHTIEAIFHGTGTTMDDVLISGTTVDIFWQDVNNTIPGLLRYDMQYDMSDLIRRSGLDLDKLEPTSVQIIRDMSDGNMYALPIILNTAVLYYNQDLFDTFGVPTPQDGMTWGEIFELARLMHRTHDGEQYYGIRSHVQPHANLNPLSVPLLDPQTQKPTILTDDRWRTIFQNIITMRRTTNNQSLSFLRHKVAMSEDLANIFINNDMTFFNWDMVTYPIMEGAPDRGAQTLPTLFGITSVSKQKEAAMEVLAYLLSEEEQLSLSERAVIPALQSEAVLAAFGSKSIHADKNLKAIVGRPFAPNAPKSNYDNDIRNIYISYLVDLTSGAIDLNTAFREIEEKIIHLIEATEAR